MAGWTAGDDLNAAIPFGEVHLVNVRFHDRPVHDRRESAALVRANRVAGLGIKFHDGRVLEPQVACPQGQSAGTREKFDAFHLIHPFTHCVLRQYFRYGNHENDKKF